MKKDFSRDLKDINYFIDHVDNQDARVDVLEKMGYETGVNIVTEKNNKVGNIVVGKRGELRIQITSPKKGFPLAKCVVLK